HLTALDHREIALLAGPRGSWTSREIRRSAAATARAAGAVLTVLGRNQPTEEAGSAVADQVRRTGATAVLAYNDLLAIGLLDGLERLGVRVPADLSVVGIAHTLARFSRPSLT